MNRRVVITGVGAVSPLGVGAEAHWRALVSGRSAVSRVDRLARLGFPVDVAAEVRPEDFVACLSRLSRKQVKLYNRTTALALAAAALAAADAGIVTPVPDPLRAGVFLATLFIPYPIQSVLRLLPDVEAADTRNHADLGKALARCLRDVNPLDLSLKVVPNLTAGHLAISFGLRGACRTLADGWTGGLHAIAQAATAIREGSLDLVLCGGAECPLEDLVFADLCATELLSSAAEPPERTCRPFGVGRHGTVAGEGAAILVMEAEEHAARRGARIRAACAGFRAASAAASPAGIRDALERSMLGALAESHRETADAISLHGNGGVASDLGEASAFHALAARTGAPPVAYATKGAHGNLFSAAGPLEAVSAVMALEAGAVPPSRNCDETDPECGLSLATDGALPMPVLRTVVVNALGAFGEAASLAVTRAAPA
jgi:3-oxoacyl-[acyl-carrier-protein] synthase II